MLSTIQGLDEKGGNQNLQGNFHKERLAAELELESLMEAEEIYWQQRGRDKIILEGDANTSFFHLTANGRRRKKTILSLEHEGSIVTDPSQIQEIIYAYYKDLFGKGQPRKVSLMPGVWPSERKLSMADNEMLNRTFTEEEVKKSVFEMKENTAPGPNGFGVTFYKKCWNLIKGELMEMINDFYLGNLDLTKLNYGIVTLVPKVVDANNEKQFRPICLLNVSFKIFTKLVMDRLTEVAGKIISPSQTAFIKGRYILDGAVMLHEIIHELQTHKEEGVIFKIDFEKA